jgi:hypothetical protein
LEAVAVTLPVSTAVLFYSDSGVADPFTLDSPTSGVLDSDVLEGITPVDITADVYAITVQRGRSRWLDDFQAGTCSISLDNRTRTYDPTGGGTYSTDIVPGKRFRVTTGGTPIFDGTADDWDIAYSLGGDSVASVVISDGFSDLGHTILTETSTTSQLSGARLTAILDRADVNFPTAYRDIDAGVTTLQADTIADGTDVASYAQLIARTEGGRLFMAADGDLTFRDRYETQTTVGALKFADDGTGVPYYGIQVAVGSELLFNRALVTRVGGTQQTADNLTSQDAYGVRTLEYSNLLFNSDTDSDNFAEYLVSRYGTPEVRISQIDINLHALDVTQAGNVIGTELGDVIQVVYSPPGGGTAIDRYAVVDRISHEIGPQQHNIVFGLSKTAQAFTLDSDPFGELDSDYPLGY